MSIGLTALVAIGSTQAADEPMSIDDVARLQRVGEVAVAPDGERVAFTRAVPRDPFAKDDGPPWSELWVASSDTDMRGYITGETNVSQIAWTPDGRAVSFVAKRGDDEHPALYRIPVNGGEARKVLEHDTAIGEYMWSPDGSQVAFVAKEAEPERLEKLADHGFKANVYEERLRYKRVWIADIDDGEAAEPHQLELDGSASELRWGPQGERLALALAPTPLIDDHYMDRTVHVVSADDGEVLARIDNPGKLGQIRWSPDGEQLAFVSAKSIHDTRAGRLMLAPAAGGEPTSLVPDYKGHIHYIAWRDADTIAYVAAEGVFSRVAEVDTDAGETRELVPTGGPVLHGISSDDSGSVLAFAGDSPRHPDELFVLGADDDAPQRWTSSNPWLADRQLAEQEVVTYTARDGLELRGILIRPLDADPERRYPLIISVHGGPESRETNGWLTRYAEPGQVAAGKGYAVFYPNYRGSTGRGVAFAKTSQGDYAGAEFNDLVDAKAHLVDQGLADPERVGITGGSYGGYASAWGATALTEHFAASVMFVGISDLISKLGTTDIPREMYLVHARKWPWDDWQYYLKRSPVYHTGNTQTPILIMGGADDTRVHPSQSLELYRYLKLRSDVPVRLVRYPGEGHGNDAAAARYDYHRRMLRWMDHYLKGEGGAPPEPDLDYDLERLEGTANGEEARES